MIASRTLTSGSTSLTTKRRAVLARLEQSTDIVVAALRAIALADSGGVQQEVGALLRATDNALMCFEDLHSTVDSPLDAIQAKYH